MRASGQSSITILSLHRHSALVNTLVPCAWLLSGALEVWSLRLLTVYVQYKILIRVELAGGTSIAQTLQEKLKPTYVILTSSHAKKLAFLCTRISYCKYKLVI